jgi:hypothetical protein
MNHAKKTIHSIHSIHRPPLPDHTRRGGMCGQAMGGRGGQRAMDKMQESPTRGAGRVYSTLAAVMAAHPLLTPHGYRIGRASGTYAQQRAELMREGARLFVPVCQWVRSELHHIRTINNGRSSYTLKHICENAIGEYVSNGLLIAAMLACGFAWASNGTPNLFFSVSSPRRKRSPGS